MQETTKVPDSAQEIAAPQAKKETIFTNTNYLLLFFGGLVSRLGSGINYIGLIWYIMEIKGSGFAVGTILMLASLPGVLLGPFSGVLVDRFDRKKIIIWMDVFRGVIATSMGVLIITGTMNYTYLIIGTVLNSIFSTLFNPAVTASIPNIVKDEHLSKANSLEHISMNVTGVVGPAIGGVLIGIWGVPWAFILNGISFLLSAFSEIFIQFPPQQRKAEGKIQFFSEMKEGAAFFYESKALFYTMGCCLFANFLYSGAFTVALPLILRNTLGATAQEFGVFEACWPIGATVGALILTALPEFKKAFKIFVSSILIQTVFTAGIGLVSLPLFVNHIGLSWVKVIVITCLLIGGIFNAMVNIPIFVIFQRMVPDDKRGRIFSLTGTISQGLTPVSIGLTGIIADLVSPGYFFVFTGIGMVAIMLWFVSKKEVHTL